MTGTQEIILYNNKLRYRLTVKSNITLLRGDSATGKSELIRLLTMHNGNPRSSGITLICDRECTVLNEENWQPFMQLYHGRIFFIDGGNSFLRTQEFADTVRNSDNCFVIISRENLPLLSRQTDEIYGLRVEKDAFREEKDVFGEGKDAPKEGKDAGRYQKSKQICNEMYRICITGIDKGGTMHVSGNG